MIHEEKTILQCSLALLQAQMQRDETGLAALLHDDYAGFDAHGNGLDKARALALMLDSPLSRLNVTDIRIALLGESALETGILHGWGDVRAHRYRYSQIWLRRDGHWTLRGSQLTELR